MWQRILHFFRKPAMVPDKPSNPVCEGDEEVTDYLGAELQPFLTKQWNH